MTVEEIIRFRITCPVCGYRSGEYSTPEFARGAFRDHVKATHQEHDCQGASGYCDECSNPLGYDGADHGE